MIQQVKFLNPTTNTEDELNIEIENYNENNWTNYTNILTKNIYNELNNILSNMITKLYKDKLYFDTTSFNYKDNCCKYFRLLYNLPILEYNKYLDLFIDNHCQNLIYEYNFRNTIIPISKNKKIKTNETNKKVKNVWTKHETKDIFTNKIIYTYENLKTKEVIDSDNPNLLEELNSKKSKKKDIEIINIKDVQFNF